MRQHHQPPEPGRRPRRQARPAGPLSSRCCTAAASAGSSRTAGGQYSASVTRAGRPACDSRVAAMPSPACGTSPIVAIVPVPSLG